MNLFEASQELRRRLARLFVPDESGRRACHGDDQRYAIDPHWRDLPLFYEYFTATRAVALAQAIKPDGLHWSQQFFVTFAGNREALRKQKPSTCFRSCLTRMLNVHTNALWRTGE